MLLRTVVIDDDQLCIDLLTLQIQKYNFFSIVGVYTDPIKALDEIKNLNLQLVFLDIDMPELNGMDLAVSLLDACPGVKIIFVSSYDQYAVSAFYLYALDYLLKPISPDRFSHLADRISKLFRLDNFAKPVLNITCMGEFEVRWDTQPPIKWRSKKTRELFALLFQYRNRIILKDQLMENLWPETDPTKAQHLLHNCVYYIRKTLKANHISQDLIEIDDLYCMKVSGVSIDCDELLGLHGDDFELMDLEQLKNLESLFRGSYMASTDWLWSQPSRTELEIIYEQLLDSIADRYNPEQHASLLEQVLLKAYNLNPYKESTTIKLIKLYIILNKRHLAILHYYTYAKLIRNEFGIAPAKELKEAIQILANK